MEIKDRIVEHPNRVKLLKVENTASTYDVTPDEGAVIQEGTPINSELFNQFEDEIKVYTDATNSKVSDVEKEIDDTNKNIADVNAKVASLANTVAGYDARITDAETKADDCVAKVNTMNGRVDEIEEATFLIGNKVMGYDDRMNAMEETVNSCNQSVTEMQDAVTKNTSDIGTLKTDVSRNSADIAVIQAAGEEVVNTVTAQGESITALDGRVTALEEGGGGGGSLEYDVDINIPTAGVSTYGNGKSALFTSNLQWIDNFICCKQSITLTNTATASMTDNGTSAVADGIYTRTATDGKVYMTLDLNAVLDAGHSLTDYLTNAGYSSTSQQQAALDFLPYFSGAFVLGGNIENIVQNADFSSGMEGFTPYGQLSYDSTVNGEAIFNTIPKTGGSSIYFRLGINLPAGKFKAKDWLYFTADLRKIEGDVKPVNSFANVGISSGDSTYYNWSTPQTKYGIGQTSSDSITMQIFKEYSTIQAQPAGKFGVKNVTVVNLTTSGLMFFIYLNGVRTFAHTFWFNTYFSPFVKTAKFTEQVKNNDYFKFGSHTAFLINPTGKHMTGVTI